MRLFTVMAVLGLIVAPASANYLNDASFELENVLNDWTIGSSHGVSWDRQNPDGGDRVYWRTPSDGDVYCEIGAGGDKPDRWAQLTQVVPVTPGEALTLSADFGGGGSNQVELWLDDGVGGTYYSGVVSNLGGGWTTIGGGITAGDADVTVVIEMHAFGSWGAAGGAMVDNVILTPEPASLALLALAGLPLLRRRR